MNPSPNKTPTKIFIKQSATPERVLLVRCGWLFVLLLIILAIFWFDRDGIKDQVDDDVSFSDIVYFTAVTVTTVGYGDIIPVSDRARIMDALLVTPLRLVIWLIFLDTAYELVLQRWMEKRRMKKLQSKLKNHLVICGFGLSGQSAAREAVVRGAPPEEILVIDENADCAGAAADAGYLGLVGDATREQTFIDASISTASTVMICLSRDDATVLSVLTVRQLNSNIRIVCSVNETENVKLVYQAGADAIVSPSVIGGYLMTNSMKSSFIADYVSDLMRAEGKVVLTERKALTQDVGMRMRDIGPGLVVRLHRKNESIGFWEGERTVVQADDVLLLIEPNAAGSNTILPVSGKA